MRVLTATSATQGDRPDDYCWATEGELVSLPVLECSCPDCGCDRGFAGLDSHRATTTCVVAESELDRAGLRRCVVASLADSGWLVGRDPTTDGPDPEVVDRLDDLHRLAATPVLRPDGVGDGPEPPDVDLSPLDRELVDDVVDRIVAAAAPFAPGAVLGRAAGGLVVRRPAPTSISG